MQFSTSARNAAVTAVAVAAVFESLHDTFPGDTGAGELTGGTPPYARQAQVWGPASAGQSSATLQPTFNVPAGKTVRWRGLWSALTNGTFYGWSPLGGGIPKPFTAQALTEIATVEAHGFAEGTQVVVISTGSTALPAPLSEGTIYFVRNPTTNTFQLATTSGGAPLDLTGDGAGFVTTIVPETYGAQGTLKVDSDTLSFNQ